MRGFAISSAVEGYPLTADIMLALTENLRRFEAMWGVFLTDPASVQGLDPETRAGLIANAEVWGRRANVDVVWNAEIGAVDPDPNLSVVQLVAALPEGTPQGVIAYHTADGQGRPTSLISIVAAGLDWPSAMSHELKESRLDAPCSTTVPGPDGKRWALESDDPLEGSDYPENGVMVSNGAGPRYFGLTSEGPLAINPAVSEPFQELPTGYHEADGVAVFGDEVPPETRAHVLSEHGRPGLRRAKR